MIKLQKILSNIEKNGVSKQDIINIEKEYGNFITTTDGVHINMFTKVVSKTNQCVVMDIISKKIKELKSKEDIINLSSFTKDIMLFNDFISDLKTFIKDNPIDNSLVMYSRSGHYLSYYDDEKEVAFLGNLPINEALVNKSNVLITINESTEFKLLLKQYEELEDKTSTIFTTLNDAISFVDTINPNIARYEKIYEGLKNKIKELIVSTDTEIVNEFNSSKIYLGIPKNKANIVILKIVISLFLKD